LGAIILLVFVGSKGEPVASLHAKFTRRHLV
jgi:hypothetical protein